MLTFAGLISRRYVGVVTDGNTVAQVRCVGGGESRCSFYARIILCSQRGQQGRCGLVGLRYGFLRWLWPLWCPRSIVNCSMPLRLLVSVLEFDIFYFHVGHCCVVFGLGCGKVVFSGKV